MKFFKVAKEVGVCYLAGSAGTTMLGATFGGIGGAVYGAGKALVSKEIWHRAECPEFMSEASTFPGKIIENVDYISTLTACHIDHFATVYAFFVTSTAWNMMNYAAIGGAYGSLPVSYPFFYAYERIYNEITSKNPITPSIEDTTCTYEPHEDEDIYFENSKRY